MSGTVPTRVSPKRLLPVAVLVAVAAAIFVVSGATAGVGIHDDPCPTVAGEHTNTCPAGTVGVAYSIQFKEAEGSGCGPGKQTFTVDSGTFPPGLTLSPGGVVSGTPTQAGSFEFYIKIAEPVGEPGCSGSVGEKRFTIPINPGIPKLTIGPEAAPVGTVGASYSLPMTANLSEPKTWSVVAGALPSGLTLDAGSGMISGTPTAAGSFGFTVQAVIDAQRTDTKALMIDVRNPLAIATPAPFELETRIARTEVGVLFSTTMAATGGLGPYTWTQTGTLPPGIEFDVTTGSVSGRAELNGTYGFALSVGDTEGRTASYAGTIVVAKRLAIATKRLKKGKVGRPYLSKLASIGGVAPLAWRIKRGPLPRGIRFDRTTGSFLGIPVKRGIWVIAVEIVDALRVKTTTNVVVVIAPARKPKR
jgi:hypothetical protein